jgi:ribonuclease HI
MELRACIEALRFIGTTGPRLGVTRAVILSDSQYVCEGARNAPYWPAGQAVNHEGRPIENRDLWREFLRALSAVPFRVQLRWVPGKSTQILREVDKLAKQAAKNPLATDYGYAPGAIARRATRGHQAAHAFPAEGQSATIRIYRIQLRKTLGVRQHKIFFDLFSEGDGDYIATYFAYLPAENEIHRNRCYAVTFNHSPTYPLIGTVRALEKCPERTPVDARSA